MALLFDVNTAVRNYMYMSTKKSTVISPQTTLTKTYYPTTISEYTYNPNIIIESPGAGITTKKEGATSTPTFTVAPTSEVSPTLSDEPIVQEAPISQGGLGGGSATDIIIILIVLGIIGGIGYKMYKKKKKKK